MSMDTSFINIKMLKRGTKICAFCKHWYDPTNSAIAPKNSISGIWTYEKKTKRKCMIMNYDKPGGALGCPKFECKL